MVWFIVLQLVNVCVSTVKSIVTVNGTAWTASLWNALSYTISAVATKMITIQSFEVVIGVTLVTNIIGVYLAKTYLELKRPERLRIINSTVRSDLTETIENSLRKRGIQYTLAVGLNDRYLFSIYAYTKAESGMVYEILNKHNLRYNSIDSLT